MKESLVVGIKGNRSVVVDETNTASSFLSGNLDVFATPAMIALMENTALQSVKGYLEEGQGTVGTLVNVTHIAATPMGATVCCESELVEIDRKRLVFKVSAYDDGGMIGSGMHERFIIDVEKFMEKVRDKF